MALLVENAPFAVAMFDREMRYMVVSPRWRDIFKLAGREHSGRSARQVFPGMPRRFRESERRVLQGEVVSRAEDRFTDSEGHTHWVRWEACPWRDGDGRVGFEGFRGWYVSQPDSGNVETRGAKKAKAIGAGKGKKGHRLQLAGDVISKVS